MKTLKEFVNSSKVEQQIGVQEIFEQKEFEATDLPSIVISEEDKKNQGNPKDPAAILIMRRKAIRQYPNGQRVALYYVDKLNKYVTVPYSDLQLSAMPENYVPQTKQQCLEESLITFMTYRNTSKNLQENVLKVYKKLNEQNKERFVDLAKEDFRQMIDFVKKNI